MHRDEVVYPFYKRSDSGNECSGLTELYFLMQSEYSAERKKPQTLKGLLKEICIRSVKCNWRCRTCLFKFYPLTFMPDKFAN